MLIFSCIIGTEVSPNLYVSFSDLAAISWQYEAITELTEPVKKSDGFKFLLSH